MLRTPAPWIELAALAVVAIAPLPMPAAWLLGIASVSMWARGLTWGPSLAGATRDVTPPELLPIGVMCGAIALVAALALSAPLGDLTGRAVEWSQYAMVRGSPLAFVVIGLTVAAQAIAIEMALRGWLVPRVLEVVPRGGGALAAIVSGVAEAAVTPGHVATRTGAFALGVGGAILFLGGGRRLVTPLACRLTFELGAVLLAALRVVG